MNSHLKRILGKLQKTTESNPAPTEDVLDILNLKKKKAKLPMTVERAMILESQSFLPFSLPVKNGATVQRKRGWFRQ